jgi:predicted RNase H-like HicB family nuclease
MTFHFPVRIVQKEQRYVASCPVLDVYSQGDTPEQAQNNLVEALTLFLTSCFERGTLDAVLKECGFHIHKTSLPSEGKFVNIPIYLLQQSHQSPTCHA